MSLGTLERERGDDRRPEVLAEHLQEIYDRPSVSEQDRTDEVDVSEARIGEFAPIELGSRNSLHPTQLGRIGLRHAPIRPHEVEIYTGP